jgi:predicted N-acetyltransferase YhbS
MVVRQASRADMAAVAELSRELAAHVNDPDPGPDAAMLLDCGFGPDRWFECLIAEDENRVVGFALFCRRFEAHTREKRLWLGDLCVTGVKRRDSIGHALIAAVQARAAELKQFHPFRVKVTSPVHYPTTGSSRRAFASFRSSVSNPSEPAILTNPASVAANTSEAPQCAKR